MFITALLITVKTWKPARCPSVDEWINSDTPIYSVLKINELSNYKKTWRNLKCILLSEKSQAEKAIYYMASTI